MTFAGPIGAESRALRSMVQSRKHAFNVRQVSTRPGGPRLRLQPLQPLQLPDALRTAREQLQARRLDRHLLHVLHFRGSLKTRVSGHHRSPLPHPALRHSPSAHPSLSPRRSFQRPLPNCRLHELRSWSSPSKLQQTGAMFVPSMFWQAIGHMPAFLLRQWDSICTVSALQYGVPPCLRPDTQGLSFCQRHEDRICGVTKCAKSFRWTTRCWTLWLTPGPATHRESVRRRLVNSFLKGAIEH